MRNLLTVTVLGALALVIFLAKQAKDPGSSTKDARTGFNPAQSDLGTQTWNSDTHFVAEFMNHGSSAVVIEAVNVSCSCLIPNQDYVGRSVQPGDTLTLEGLLNTGYQPGTLTRTLTIVASNAKTHQFTLTCNVVPTYTLDPARLEFSATEKMPLTVDLNSKYAVTFVSATADKPWVYADVSERTIEVHIDWDLVPPGMQQASLNIYTDDALVSGMRVPITIRNFRRMHVYPSVVYLRDDNCAVVSPRGAEELSITGVQGLPDVVAGAIRSGTLRLHRKSGLLGLQTFVYVDLNDGSQLGFTLFY
jgi:hypothetical protein